ncbi:MAG: hypothetical protein KDB37_06295 [Ilumatobacter sp.]|nr:hypothetical protein [Ilumatobacter sp.]
MSIEVPISQLSDEVPRWGFGYLVTVGDDARAHLLALRPTVEPARDPDGVPVLRFDVGGGRAARNTAIHPNVTIVFPPAPHADGMSLIIDGEAADDDGTLAVTPTWAVLHRRAPA